ncbi:MAG: D-alanyl-D-alanine carboxypeptidase/D-alanyl-D-alanine-endopeptidase, partial [bacterium]
MRGYVSRSPWNRATVPLAGLLLAAAAACAGTVAPPGKVEPVLSGGPGEGPLAEELDVILDDPSFAQAFWGVKIQRLDTGTVLYERNADALMMPASNMKLLTTAAALLRLPPDRRPVTLLFTLGTLDDGVLTGDLILVGGGDPSLGGRFGGPDPLRGRGDPWIPMRALADSVRSAGIRRVEGRIVAVDDLFEEEPLGYGWAWDNLVYGYAAPVNALTWNEAVVCVIVEPAASAGEAAGVHLFPDVGAVRLDARVSTGGPMERSSVRLSRDPGSDLLRVRGRVPEGSRPDTSEAAVPDPPRYAALGLLRALSESGIQVMGGVVDQDELPGPLVTFQRGRYMEVPAAARRIGTVEGPEIIRLVRLTNKISQNLYAETLLRLIPAMRSGMGSTSSGRGEVESALLGLGIPPGRFVQRDGSGLSRYNYVSPEVLTRLLRGMARSRRAGAWHQSLPLMGVDGTLRGRG